MSKFYKLNISGVDYGMGDIKAAKIVSPMFDKFSAGNTCAAELTAEIWPTNVIPEMAKIIPYVRNSEAEEWRKLGVFYIDERVVYPSGRMTITAYNSMLFAEQEWVPNDDLVFPMSMPDVVTEIARLMGVGVDSRTVLNSAYTIDYPANGYTLREVLGYIAGAHGGNWIITADDELLLVPLFSEPAETNYLITENGSAIVIGGVRLLV